MIYPDISESRTQFFQSLYDLDPMVAFHEIANPHPRTCHWILDNVKFRSWVAPNDTNGEDARFFWISGSPGCGKSTLAKYIIAHLASHPDSTKLPEQDGRRNCQAVSFVFCSDTDLRGNNTAVALRSL